MFEVDIFMDFVTACLHEACSVYVLFLFEVDRDEKHTRCWRFLRCMSDFALNDEQRFHLMVL